MTDQIRRDEPGYVAKYRARHRELVPGTSSRVGADDTDDAAPLYLRRYRTDRRVAAVGSEVRLGNAALAHGPAQLANDVYLVRHGEVDPVDAGLTEQGVHQAYTYGRQLGEQCRDGERVVIRHAGTDRTSQTADHIVRGLVEGSTRVGREIDLVEPAPMAEFANFRFVGPDGPDDLTEVFRRHYAPATERAATGGQPLWLLELDRFWQLQISGGDPIAAWLSLPFLHVEPSSMVVRRMWVGIGALGDAHPGARLVLVTHSGPMRAFAMAALGYDPSEPYNLEHVRARILRGRTDAIISYRNRYQEICVPNIAGLPVWNTVETWQPPEREEAPS